MTAQYTIPAGHRRDLAGGDRHHHLVEERQPGLRVVVDERHLSPADLGQGEQVRVVEPLGDPARLREALAGGHDVAVLEGSQRHRYGAGSRSPRSPAVRRRPAGSPGRATRRPAVRGRPTAAGSRASTPCRPRRPRHRRRAARGGPAPTRRRCRRRGPGGTPWSRRELFEIADRERRPCVGGDEQRVGLLPRAAPERRALCRFDRVHHAPSLIRRWGRASAGGEDVGDRGTTSSSMLKWPRSSTSRSSAPGRSPRCGGRGSGRRCGRAAPWSTTTGQRDRRRRRTSTQPGAVGDAVVGVALEPVGEHRREAAPSQSPSRTGSR